jgi:hypothetical protein
MNDETGRAQLGAKSSGAREIAVPITVFTALRRELEKEVGTLPAVRSLHHAGYEVGTEAAAGFVSGDGERVAELTTSDFWNRLERFFSRRGWGSIRHEAAHGGVGMLVSSDWVEGSADETDSEGSCSFSTGFLAGLLSTLADRPVAVLEVTCRTRGDDACRFAFGAEAVVHDLYGRLVDGSDLTRALSEI